MILDKGDEIRTHPKVQDKRLIMTLSQAKETVRRLLVQHADLAGGNQVVLLHSLMDERVMDLLKCIIAEAAAKVYCVSILPLSVGMGPTAFHRSHQVLYELPDYCCGVLLFESDEHLRDWKTFEEVFASVARLLKHLLGTQENFAMLNSIIFSEEKVALLKVSPCKTVSVPEQAEYGMVSNSVSLGLGQTTKKGSSRFIRAFGEEGMMIVGGLKLTEKLHKSLLR